MQRAFRRRLRLKLVLTAASVSAATATFFAESFNDKSTSNNCSSDSSINRKSNSNCNIDQWYEDYKYSGLHYRQQQPLYTRNDVKQSKRLLTTFRNGVYDLTSFNDIHPGGKEIHRCHNGNLDKYFNLFPHHKKQEVLDLLEELKVGVLVEEDRTFVDSRSFNDSPLDHFVEFIVEQDVDTFISSSSSSSSSAVATSTSSNSKDISATTSPNPTTNTITTTKSFSINELMQQFPVREIRVGVACGFNEWKGRWEEELAHFGGAKMHKGVWLGDLLSYLGMDCSDKDVLNSMFVHYHCYDDYIDTVPLSCLNKVSTSLLVYNRDGHQLTSDKPTPGGGPLMALTAGTSEEYPCDAKWITKIVVNKRSALNRYGGKYGDIPINMIK